MGTLVEEIVSAIQSSLVNGAVQLQQELKLEALPIQASGGIVTFTIPKSQKLDKLLNQPNNIRVPASERRNKDGTTVTVQSHKRRTSKPTLTKAIEACEADEVNTQQTNDVISAFIAQQIEIGLENLKLAAL